uniref:Uncharacterized protein n=1 Tax=Cannabis sativa TaxID=3483 RepID=A0A803P9Q7_CANSA
MHGGHQRKPVKRRARAKKEEGRPPNGLLGSDQSLETLTILLLAPKNPNLASQLPGKVTDHWCPQARVPRRPLKYNYANTMRCKRFWAQDSGTSVDARARSITEDYFPCLCTGPHSWLEIDHVMAATEKRPSILSASARPLGMPFLEQFTQKVSIAWCDYNPRVTSKKVTHSIKNRNLYRSSIHPTGV